MIELINKKDKLELTKPTGGTPITVDSELSTESTNPVENRVITNKINEIEDSIPEVDWDYNSSSPNAQSGNAVWEATSAIVRNYQQLSKATELDEITYSELWRRLLAEGGLFFHTRGTAFTGAESDLQLPAGAYVAYYNSSYNVAGCWNLDTGVLYTLNGYDLFDTGEYSFYVESPFVELQNSVGDIETEMKNDPNCHAEFFTITTTGTVSLKPEYRGASSNAVTYPDSVSDMGEWAGSLNEALPTNLVIPEKVDGITVSALAEGMFLDNQTIVSVTLPSTITDIPIQCFNQALNLSYLYNTDNIKTIGDRAFRYTRIEKLILPNLEAFTGTLAFSNAIHLTYIYVGKVTTISKSTFKHCLNLRTVVAPNVTVVEQEAFSNTVRLESIDFVKNLTQIDQHGFWVTKYNDWSELSSTATLGDTATVEKINPTGDNFWTNTKPTPCKNPTPTAFCQRDSRWADSVYGASNRAYKDGCLQFCIIHAYSGLTGKKYNTPFEFEEDVKAIKSISIDGTTYSGEELLKLQNGTITKAGILAKALFSDVTVDEGIWTSNDLSALYKTLAEGGYAILAVNLSPTGSHAILAHGITENGEIMLLDSELRVPYDNTKASRYNLPFNKLIWTNSSRSDFMLIPKLRG